MSTYMVVASVSGLVFFVALIVELKSIRTGLKKMAYVSAVVAFLSLITSSEFLFLHLSLMLHWFGKTR